QAFAPELEPACEGHARPARSWSGATCTSASGQMPMRKAYLLSPRARIGRRGNTVPDSRTYGHPLRGVSVSVRLGVLRTDYPLSGLVWLVRLSRRNRPKCRWHRSLAASSLPGQMPFACCPACRFRRPFPHSNSVATDFERAGDDITIGTILHPLDGNHDVVGGVALRGELGGARAGQGGVAAGSGAIDAAVVDDDDRALERGADCVSGVDVGGHVLVAALGASDAAVEGVEHDRDGPVVAELAADRGDESTMVADQVEGYRFEIERHLADVVGQEALPEGN